MQSQMETIRQQRAERLELIREHTGMIQSDFAKYLDLEPGSYSDIKRVRVGISQAVLKRLEKKLNVNLEWLLTGIGEMSLDSGESATNTAPGDTLIPYRNQSSEGVNAYIDRLFKIIERRDEQIDKLMHQVQEEKANIAKVLVMLEKISVNTNKFG